ncbi:MAG TPA: hypothetical protein VN736_10730 [Candidatus Limnocylindrales bacterium]|nr:hypothetical protein [Candidatus Limnocylindrales bacterium]
MTNQWLTLAAEAALRHVFILGNSGYGKTSLIKEASRQAIEKGWGRVDIIQHSDLQPFLLGSIAAWERQTQTDLSERTVIIAPPDRVWATGMNLLEAQDEHELFVLAAELAEMIRVRFGLESIGVRILELLRNTVFVLASTHYTLAEFRLFLHSPAFRTALLQQVTNAEIRSYFSEHYDRLSAAEQGIYAAALLNKISDLSADPLVADVLGQRQSAVSLTNALDRQMWLLFNVDKAVLREQSATLAGLFFIRLKNAIFARRRRGIVMVTLDEAQNIVRTDSGLDTALAETRKYGASLFCSCQQLHQITPPVRAALLGVGTQIFFRTSGPDSAEVAKYLDGGKHLAERLRNLPQRHAIVKTGDEYIREIEIPILAEPAIQTRNVYERCMRRWARPRTEVEAEIRQRHEQFTRTANNALDNWE